MTFNHTFLSLFLINLFHHQVGFSQEELICAIFLEVLNIWEWLLALSLQSDLIKCNILQSRCLSLRMLHISSLCSQLFLLLQIKSKVNMNCSQYAFPHFPFGNRKTPSFKSAHPAGGISQPSLQPNRSMWLCFGQWTVSRSGMCLRRCHSYTSEGLSLYNI